MNTIKKVNWIKGIPKPRASYSHLVRAGDYVFIAGQLGIDPETGKVPKSIEEQMALIFEAIKKLLESEGGSFENVIKTTAFLSDTSYHEIYDEVYRSYFDKYPARSTVQAKLMHPECKIEIDAIAYIPKNENKL